MRCLLRQHSKAPHAFTVGVPALTYLSRYAAGGVWVRLAGPGPSPTPGPAVPQGNDEHQAVLPLTKSPYTAPLGLRSRSLVPSTSSGLWPPTRSMRICHAVFQNSNYESLTPNSEEPRECFSSEVTRGAEEVFAPVLCGRQSGAPSCRAPGLPWLRQATGIQQVCFLSPRGLHEEA